MNRRSWNARPLPWPFLSNEPGSSGIGAPESHIVIVAVRDPRLRSLADARLPMTRLELALAARQSALRAARRRAKADSDWPVSEEFADGEPELRVLGPDEVEPLAEDSPDQAQPRKKPAPRQNPRAFRDERRRADSEGAARHPRPAADIADDDRRAQREERTRTRVPRFRPLFVEPGLSRVVNFGDFKDLLSSQLAHPERLRDSHRLPCRVQVYEAFAPVRLGMLAAMVFGSSERASQLRRFEGDVIARLGLGELPASRGSGGGERSPEILGRFERVFRLEVAEDPTRFTTQASAAPAATPQGAGPATPAAESPVPEDFAAAFASLPTPRVNAEAPASACGFTVPERFLRPWEFQRSREEAIYDMQSEIDARGPMAALRRKLSGNHVRVEELRRWRVLLRGKSLDEQLWSVRPPHHGLRTRVVREWAESALAAAGYSPNTMIDEWEIFWRRKGV